MLKISVKVNAAFVVQAGMQAMLRAPHTIEYPPVLFIAPVYVLTMFRFLAYSQHLL